MQINIYYFFTKNLIINLLIFHLPELMNGFVGSSALSIVASHPILVREEYRITFSIVENVTNTLDVQHLINQVHCLVLRVGGRGGNWGGRSQFFT